MGREEQTVSVEQRIKSAQKQAVSYRNYRRARERAMTRLVQAYPDEYKMYLQEEKARDEQENKKWLDITGATNSDSEFTIRPTTPDGNGDTTSGTYQGYDGGEE